MTNFRLSGFGKQGFLLIFFICKVKSNVYTVYEINNKGVSMNFGKSLKIALAKREISQSDLAKELNVTRAYISNISRKKECSGGVLRMMAKHFGLKVSEFVALGED